MADTVSREIRLDFNSRYRNTRVFQDTFDQGKVVFFGTWRPPVIIETQDPIRYKVTAEEIYRPGLVSYRVYGDSSLFWAIAMRNNLMFPLLDLKTFAEDARKVLLCPQLDDIQRALQAASARG